MDYPYSAPYPAANNAATDRRANIHRALKRLPCQRTACQQAVRGAGQAFQAAQRLRPRSIMMPHLVSGCLNGAATARRQSRI
ncbi:MAG: hypothetical protein ACFNLD_04945 [Kingella oralis]